MGEIVICTGRTARNNGFGTQLRIDVYVPGTTIERTFRGKSLERAIPFIEKLQQEGHALSPQMERQVAYIAGVIGR